MLLPAGKPTGRTATWLGGVWPGMARQALDRHGGEWQGPARPGKARDSAVRKQAAKFPTRLHWAGPGKEGRGKARCPNIGHREMSGSIFGSWFSLATATAAFVVA